MAPQGIHGLQVWAMAPSFPSLATSMACEQSGPGGRDGLSRNFQVTSAESAKRHQQWSVRNKVVRPVPAAQGSSGVDILVPRAPENSPTDLKVEATGSFCPWQVRGEVTVPSGAAVLTSTRWCSALVAEKHVRSPGILWGPACGLKGQ